MIHATVGFMFSPDKKKVLLIEKTKPDFMAGKLNGVGGKMEPDELSIDAMVREFEEETGIQTTPQDWSYFANIEVRKKDKTKNEWRVFFYYTVSDKIGTARQTTEEKLVIAHVDAIYTYHTVDNLRWTIPFALDPHRKQESIQIYYEERN